MAKKDAKADAYVENVGHEPHNLPDDHPDKWQWEYLGTKAERDVLLERLGLEPEEEELLSQDESLF